MDRLGVVLALSAGLVIAVQGPMNTMLMRGVGVLGASVAFYAVALATSIVFLSFTSPQPITARVSIPPATAATTPRFRRSSICSPPRDAPEGAVCVRGRRSASGWPGGAVGDGSS